MRARSRNVFVVALLLAIVSCVPPRAADPLPSWTDASPRLSFQGIVHHTDAEREWAYDRESSIGHLDKALDEALRSGWTVVDMRADWKTVFPAGDRPQVP